MEINCSNKNYSTFESIRRTFSNTKSILKLDISSNKIRFLPSNLGSFVNLVELDLRQNPLHNYNSVIEGLKSLPKLQILWIDLVQISDEDVNIRHLLENLPKLQSLNGQNISHLRLKFMQESGHRSTPPPTLTPEKKKLAEIKMWKQKIGSQRMGMPVSEEFLPEHEEEIKITKLLKACINSLYQSQGLKDYKIQNHPDEDFKKNMEDLSGYMSRPNQTRRTRSKCSKCTTKSPTPT